MHFLTFLSVLPGTIKYEVPYERVEKVLKIQQEYLQSSATDKKENEI